MPGPEFLRELVQVGVELQVVSPVDYLAGDFIEFTRVGEGFAVIYKKGELVAITVGYLHHPPNPDFMVAEFSPDQPVDIVGGLDAGKGLNIDRDDESLFRNLVFGQNRIIRHSPAEGDSRDIVGIFH
jgi:hypothetical protein